MSVLPPNSPLFTPLQLAPVSSTASGDQNLIPQLPEKPTAHTASMQMYIIPTEKTLFFQGFEELEYEERQPVLLRGCLFVRVLKPSKIKSITLNFKGTMRTDWPEGIPPKKNVFMEENDIISHTWPFYSMANPMNAINGGADLYSELPKNLDRDVSHLNLNDLHLRALSPSVGRAQLPSLGQFDLAGNTASLRGGLMKRATSPLLNPVDSFSGLQTVNTSDSEYGKPGTFPPGDYIYNFEHPLRPLIPESTSVTFGDVNYELEATIIRSGAFKLNLVGRMPIDLVRTPSESNLEENEPIVITRDWEDQLRYDIVIGGKSIVLDSYLPLAFRFVPLWGKVALHRIRVYLSENLEYYCQNNKVHRMEPSKKYLLLEHKAKKGKSLLTKKENGEYGDENDELLPRELEFQLYVPQTLNGRINHVLHPDTSFTQIQAHHWIKLCLRISRLDPENPEKRKHYEILIDSPIHVLSPLAAHGNTLLPAYDDALPEFLPEYTPSSPPLSPGVTAVDNTQTIGKLFSALSRSGSFSSHHTKHKDEEPQIPVENFRHLNSAHNNDEPIERDADMHLEANIYKPDPAEGRSQLNSPQAMPHIGSLSPITSPMMRPIHALRRPSYNPPSFEAANSMTPDNDVPPPAYDDDMNRSSPLQVTDSSTSSLNIRGRSKTKSSLNTNSSHSSFTAPPNEVSIRDLLTNSLAGSGHRNSITSKKSQSSGDSERQSVPSIVKTKPDEIPDLGHPDGPGNSDLAPVPTLEIDNNPDSEEDIVNMVGSPDLIPEAVSPRRNLSPIGSPRRGMSPRMSPAMSPAMTPRSPSPKRRDEDQTGQDNGDVSGTESSSSRRSSATSFSSSEMPMGQNIPLLGLSTQSLLNPPNTRTASIGSILFEPQGRRLSSNNRPSIVDFMDGGDLGGDFIKEQTHFAQIRNPRRSKQKNNELVKQVEEGATTNGADKSDETLSTKDINGREAEVPGLNFKYIIE